MLLPSLLAANIIGIGVGIVALVVCGKRLAALHSAAPSLAQISCTPQQSGVQSSNITSLPRPEAFGTVVETQTEDSRDGNDNVPPSTPNKKDC